MKTLNISVLNESQKQNFFYSFSKKRWWDIIINVENKSIGISTVNSRTVYFNFWKDYIPFIDWNKTSFEELEKMIEKSYENYKKWINEETYENEYGFYNSPMDSWQGFLDTDIWEKILEKILQLDFWFWGESISFSWIEEEKTDSKFYSYCILDLLGWDYMQYNKAHLILDCGKLVFPCRW